VFKTWNVYGSTKNVIFFNVIPYNGMKPQKLKEKYSNTIIVWVDKND